MNIQELFNNWGGQVGALLFWLYFGTWSGIRSTNGPKERAFMVKAAVGTWIFIFALLGLIFGLQIVLPGHPKLWSFAVSLLIAPALCFVNPYVNRRQAQIRAEESPHTGVDPMTSAATPAAPCPGTSPSGSQSRAGTILGVVFWMFIGALVFNSLLPKKPPQQQGLRITNTGSESVDIRKLARWSWQEEEWTLQPGATGLWTFAPYENFRIARSEAPPKSDTTPPDPPLAPRFEGPDGKAFLPTRSYLWGSPAMHQNADGSGSIILRHVDRTAEVRVNEAGKIEFKFTDL